MLFDFSSILDTRLIYRLGNLTLRFIFFESIYGIVQFAWAVATYGYSVSIGDFVWGTLAPPNSRYYAGTSPFFVLLISTLLVFSFAFTPRKISLFHLLGWCTVVACWILASMVHSIVLFAVAVAVATATFAVATTLRSRSYRRLQRGVFMGIVMVGLLIYVGSIVYPANFGRIQGVLSSIRTFGPTAKYGKLRIIYDTMFELPKEIWLQPLIGVGPGQYSSRAAMIATGKYLSRSSIPFLPVYISRLTSHYVMPLFYASNSTTVSPNSSWVALYGELGLFGWITLLILLIRAIFRFTRSASRDFPRLGYAMLILVFYLFLMGFQDLYWEYTQGIFPAVLLIKLSYDFVYRRRRVRLASSSDVASKGIVSQQTVAPPGLLNHS